MGYVSEVKRPVRVDLRSIVPVYKRILSERCIKEPIILDRETMVVLKGGVKPSRL